MSLTGPNVFVTIGDTDYWSTSLRGDVAYDSTLRKALGVLNNNWESILGAATRTATTRPKYAEFFVIGDGGGGVFTNTFDIGVVRDEAAASVLSSYIGNVTDGVQYSQLGAIIKNGSVIQSTFFYATGDRPGLAFYLSGGVPKIQFYKNGVAAGTEITLSAGAYHLGWSGYNNAASVLLCVDADDQQYRPAGCDPWGAAARIADAGGYSPTATTLDVSAGSVVIDAFKRTASDTIAGASARSNGNTRTGSAIYYIEWAIEAASAVYPPLVGLMDRSSSYSSYVGATPNSWGYYGGYNGGSGAKYNNGVGTNMASASFGIGARPGALWQPSTGKLWFTKNGAVIEGNPFAGTGASFTGVTGDLLPACTPYAAGRVRLGTHAREQLYRPSYATAWDGADILPEQHYRGALNDDIRYRRSVSFWPMGGSGNRSAPVADVALLNADGYYDALLEYTLRDQPVSIYLPGSEVPSQFSRLRCDSVRADSEQVLRVLLRDRSSELEKRVAAPVVHIGKTNITPADPDDAGNRYVGHDPYLAWNTMIDGGLAVTSYNRLPGTVPGIVRTVNPALKNAITEAEHFQREAQYALTNGTLASWSGGLPVGWTVTTGGAGTVTQHANGARGQTPGGGDTATIKQSLGTFPGTETTHFAHVTLSNRVSGTLSVELWGASGVQSTYPIGGAGNGTYVVPLKRTSASSPYELRLTWSGSADFVIGGIEFWSAKTTRAPERAITHLLNTLAGWPTAAFSVPASAPWNSVDILGYWSNQQPTLLSVLNAICDAAFGAWWVDANDVMQFGVWYTASASGITWGPSITATPILSVEVQDDLAPALSDRILRSLNYAPHTPADIAGAADPTFAIALQRDGTELTNAGTGLSYDDFYAHATEATPYRTLLGSGSPPVLYVTYLTERYSARKKIYRVKVLRSALAGLDMMYMTNVTYPRYDLQSGKDLQVLGIDETVTGTTAELTLWG